MTTDNPTMTAEIGTLNIGQDKDGVLTLVLLLPENAWQIMADGTVTRFDLSVQGVALTLGIGRIALVPPTDLSDAAVH